MNRKERGLNDIIANRNAFKDWRDPKQSEQTCLSCKKMLPQPFALPTFVHDLLQTWSIIHEYIAWQHGRGHAGTRLSWKARLK